jgi:hypothetical protein
MIHILTQRVSLHQTRGDSRGHGTAITTGAWLHGPSRSGLGLNELTWFARLRREHPNLRAALEFCLTQPG